MWVQILVGTLAVLVAYLYFYIKKAYRYFEERGIKNLPPVPVFGNFMKSTFHYTHIIDDIDKIYQAFPNEKYVGAFESFSPIFFIRDPEIIKKITVKDFDHFVDHREFINLETDALFGGSLLFLKGEKWRDMRSTLSPAFTGSKMRQMLPFMNEIAHQIVTHLHRVVKPTKEGKVSDELNMEDLFKRYANDVIASCAFGHKIDSVAEKTNTFYMMGKSISDFTISQRIKLFFAVFLPTLSKSLQLSIFPESTTKFFTEMVFGTMKYRKENSVHRPDMLQLLMEAKDGTLKDTGVTTDDKMGFATAEESKIHQTSVSRKWTDIELAGQAFVFFFAGFESSSSVMTFAVHELAINPEAQSRLRDEIDECHANHPDLTFEVLQSLKYMDMVINVFNNDWKEHFDVISAGKGTWYKTMQAEPTRVPWFAEVNMNRHSLVAAFRLRSGHVPLNRFAHLMRKIPSPNCDVCGTTEDVYHLLVECRRGAGERQRLDIVSYNVGGYISGLAQPSSDAAKRIYKLVDCILKKRKEERP